MSDDACGNVAKVQRFFSVKVQRQRVIVTTLDCRYT